MQIKSTRRLPVAVAAALLGATVGAFTVGAAEKGGDIPSNPLREAFFGDLHLHTSYSFDAYVFLGGEIAPKDAYRFARGEKVSYLGDSIKRKEPLDFMAVTDHAENIGVINQLDNPNSQLSKSEIGKRLRDEGPKAFWELVHLFLSSKTVAGVDTVPLVKSAWQSEIDAANSSYQPGKFTTFIAYEWGSMPNGANLHRNIIFRGDTAPLPFTSVDSNRPEDLWTYLEENRKKGLDVLSISHNANASNGLMFDWKDSDGRPIDEHYAQRRALNEPLNEISQGKGASETHPALSPNDEFANFEIFDHLLISPAKSSVHGSYLRDAYGRGLVIGSQVGTNPYKFGMIGASDYHNGLSTSTEDTYGGTLAGLDAGHLVAEADKTQKKILDAKLSKESGGLLDTSPGNLTGVWAEKNTRESIFDALRRKETFATSGPKIKVRFFGGWDYDQNLLQAKDWAKTAYERGVPMGADLPARTASSKAPRFAILAIKDPAAANLDRAQVVKVWLDNGRYQEKIFDVALSGDRQADPKTGRGPSVGSTVDLAKATYTNSIGATQLSTLWQDPEFDEHIPAVYYLRVLEIPTPRWSTILAVKSGKPLPKDAPATIQERAWASPIWYTPASSSVAQNARP